MPAEVGYADTSSDMQNPTMRMKLAMIGQPHEISSGPPAFHARPNDVKQPARIEMIENEIAKLWKPDQERCSSCLYRARASLLSSSSSLLMSTTVPPSGTESTREDGSPVLPRIWYSGS